MVAIDLEKIYLLKVALSICYLTYVLPKTIGISQTCDLWLFQSIKLFLSLPWLITPFFPKKLDGYKSFYMIVTTIMNFGLFIRKNITTQEYICPVSIRVFTDIEYYLFWVIFISLILIICLFAPFFSHVDQESVMMIQAYEEFDRIREDEAKAKKN